MSIGRSLTVMALVAAALVTGSARTGAQEQPSPTPPDLRMLLDLDLFRPHSPDASNGGPGESANNSMLDQIRTLKAMGYLGKNPDDAAASDTPAVDRARAAAPSPPPTGSGDSRDSDDSEGQR